MSSQQPPGTAPGQVYCLFSEVLGEARRRLKREGVRGHRGKVLPMRLIAKRAHIDPKALYRLSADDLTEYEGVALAKLCRFLGLQHIGDLLQYVPHGDSRVLPTELYLEIAEGPLPRVPKRDPRALAKAYGHVECLLKERMNEWEVANHGQPLEKQDWRRVAEYWADMVRQHAWETWGIDVPLTAKTVSAWANNTNWVYNRLLLVTWCAFFGNIGIDELLRYVPPANAGGTGDALHSRTEQISEG
jgi:Cro/C1-type HTH DNA-binding domain